MQYIIIINRCVVTEFSTINIKSLNTKNRRTALALCSSLLSPPSILDASASALALEEASSFPFAAFGTRDATKWALISSDACVDSCVRTQQRLESARVCDAPNAAPSAAHSFTCACPFSFVDVTSPVHSGEDGGREGGGADCEQQHKEGAARTGRREGAAHTQSAAHGRHRAAHA